MKLGDDVYIKFRYAEFGYKAGDVVKALFKRRDDKGVHVNLMCIDDQKRGNAWSDLGGFREMSEMEVVAHFAAGLPVL